MTPLCYAGNPRTVAPRDPPSNELLALVKALRTTCETILQLPFPPMALRHRWAVRTLEYGVEVSLAAKQMGHSRDVHERIYHRRINASIHQREYDRVLSRVDRPLPPKKPLGIPENKKPG